MDPRLGKKGRDKITGFTGIIYGVIEYLYGCKQLGLNPPVENNKTGDTCWFDEGRVEIIDDGVAPEEVAGESPGAPGQPVPFGKSV